MKKYVILTLAAISMLFVWSCNNQQNSDNTSEKEVVKIGAILPLTGDIAEYGTGCKKGIDLAIEKINKNDSTFFFEVEYYDNQGETKNTTTALNRFSNQNIKFIIGPVTSSSAMAVIPVINRQKILMFSPTASSAELSGKSNYFLRLWPSDDFEAEIMASYAYSRLNISSISTIYVNNDYGLALNKHFSMTFKEKWNGNIYSEQSYAQGAKNFRDIVTKSIDTEKTEAIYIIGYHQDLAALTKQIRDFGFKGKILASSNYETEELIDLIGDYANDVIYATPSFENTDSNEYKDFDNYFAKNYNETPTIFSRNSYDIVNLLYNAIKLNKSTNVEKAINTMKENAYEGVSGNIRFNSNGDVIKPVAVKTVKQKKFELLEIYNLK